MNPDIHIHLSLHVLAHTLIWHLSEQYKTLDNKKKKQRNNSSKGWNIDASKSKGRMISLGQFLVLARIHV